MSRDADEKWVHYSDSPEQIVVRTISKHPGEPYRKPSGLWITPEDAENNWFDWCHGEKFRMDGLNYSHDVKFRKDARLLRLENAGDIDSFTKEYGYSFLSEMAQADALEFGMFEDREAVMERFMGSHRRDAIRWDRVAEKYQGILIPTYIWQRRLDAGADWYYPWDCASGCIWSPDAIESITVRSMKSRGYKKKEKLSK